MTDPKANSLKTAGRLKRIGRWISDYSVELLNTIIVLVTVVAGGFGETLFWDAWYLLLLIAVCIVAIVIVQVRRTPYSELKAEKEAAAKQARTMSTALERSISILLKQILVDSGINNTVTRASAYFYGMDDEGEHFVMVARNSANPSYRRPGRRRYPVNQGVIGKAWNRANGYFAVRQLPKNQADWNNKLVEDYGFTHEVASNITMKAASIGALRIHDNDGAVGMLVIETQNSHGITNALLEQVQASSVWDIFSEFMAAFAPITPRGSITPPPDETQEVWMPTKSAKVE